MCGCGSNSFAPPCGFLQQSSAIRAMSQEINTTRTDTAPVPLLILGSLGIVSTLICGSATIAVFACRLHVRLTYRLALYQVLGSLMHSVLITLQLLFLNYGRNIEVYGPLCVAVAYLYNSSHWIKLLALTWLTLHLFCFAVCYKNSKRLEIPLLVALVILPFVISALPFIRLSYGQTPPLWCWILNGTDVRAAMQLTVWLLPATALLLVSFVLVAVMLSVLGFRIYRELQSGEIVAVGPRKKALKQLCPLIAYPAAFIVFILPALVFSIANLSAAKTNVLKILTFLTAVSIPMWSISSGITLLVLIACYLCERKKMNRPRPAYGTLHLNPPAVKH